LPNFFGLPEVHSLKLESTSEMPGRQVGSTLRAKPIWFAFATAP